MLVLESIHELSLFLGANYFLIRDLILEFSKGIFSYLMLNS
jgi:hypothetical protein